MSWTVSDAERKRFLQGVWRGFLVSPSGATFLVALVLVCGALGVWRGGDPLIGVVIGVIVAAFGLWLIRRGLAKRVALAYPIGYVATSTATEAGLHVSSALGSTNIPWENMRHPRVIAGAVTFTLPISRLQRVGYPRFLVPDVAVERMGRR